MNQNIAILKAKKELDIGNNKKYKFEVISNITMYSTKIEG